MTKERFDQSKLVNIANSLTAIRILLLPLFAYLLISRMTREAIVVFVICGASDAFDGLIARRLHQRTLIGAYLDPIADKLLIATSFIVLAIVGIVPAWLTILVLSRDIFILVGCFLYMMLLEDAEISPTFFSKVNTGVQILTVIWFLAATGIPGVARIAPPSASSFVLGVCAVTTAISGIQYVAIGLKKLSDA